MAVPSRATLFIIVWVAVACGATSSPQTDASLDKVQIDVCYISGSALMFMAEYPQQCPTLDDLKNGFMEEGRRTQDPWQQDYVIECTVKGPDVYSLGPDGANGTPIRCENKR